ncbi:MAG: TIGR01777 family oxidoreductase [Acidimicrobiia bacterium]|nr:TIGR01777 family oxidoreductase [Acidimicrobiia bacterium]
MTSRMDGMRVLVTGATGLIGTALCASLRNDGAEVKRLVRRPAANSDELSWNPAAGELDADAVEGYDAVIHLAGAGIGDKRWSAARRKLILDSRVEPTRLLAERLAAVEKRPQVFVSASAIGFYGDRTEPVTEADGPADPADFLSEVVVAWEGATRPAADAGIRTVQPRTGIVLAKQGGALVRLLLPFRLGIGGKLGNGETVWSWITLADEVRAIKHLLTSNLHGPVNLTAPNPVTNAELTKVLGRVLRRPTVIPVPRFGLNLLLGEELATALLFTSARVLPAKLLESGFEFHHPRIESALAELLGST